MEINMKHYIVYMHRNKVNGKVYIGITGGTPERRWGYNGRGYEYNIYFYNAIKKYGWNEGFDHIIIALNLTKTEAEEMEIDLISKYDATNKSKGYNIQKGGQLGFSKTVYQYDRYKGCLLNIWENTISIEKSLGISNTHISAVCLGKMKTAQDYYFSYENLGDVLPPELLKWINTNEGYTQVAQYDLDGNFIKIYNKLADANYAVGKDGSVINFNNKTSFGYIWKRVIDDSIDYTQPLSKEELTVHITHLYTAKKCCQYSPEGIFIRMYSSVNEGARCTGSHPNCVAAACRGEYYKSNGFYWRYFDDIKEIRNLTVEEIKEMEKHGLSKPVCQYDLTGKLLQVFDKVTDAADECDGNTTNISKACKKKIKTAYGYIWRYLGEELTQEEIIEANTHNKKRKVAQFTMDDEYVATYESLAEASRKTGAKDTSISMCCIGKYKHAKGYKWKYVS